MRALRWALPYVGKYKWRLIFGQFINLINIALQLVNPYFAGLIVANVIEGGQNDLLFRYLAIMIGITMYRTVARYWFLVLFESTSQKVMFDMRRDVYDKLHRQNFTWFDKTRVGDTMSRMTGDLEAVRHFMAFDTYAIPENILLYIAAVIVMGTISWPLTGMMLLTTPFVVILAIRQSKAIRPAFRTVREEFANLNSGAGENISGNRVVKAFTKEEYEIEKFSKLNQNFYNANMTAAGVRIKFFPLIESLANILPLILLLMGGLFVIWGYLELWQMVMLSGYLWMINNPTRMFTWCVNDLQNTATSLDKIYEMMRAPIMIESPAEAYSTAVKGAVEFKNVGFRYYTTENAGDVFNDISFSVKAGQTVGIVGDTGSGKTTLTSLIARFYEVSSGEVLVDGVNVKDFDLKTLRGSIAFAMQDVFLYSDTVEGNIAFGVPETPMENVYKAAETADANEFISAMPEGYETIVGERGVGLSGGQKQRISLARAIATDPSILVLDDVTSAVDTATEQRIQTALADMKKIRERTTFIVAHRLASVKDADLILVLSGGGISERGTHEELLAAKGYYRAQWHEQNSGGGE